MLEESKRNELGIEDGSLDVSRLSLSVYFICYKICAQYKIQRELGFHYFTLILYQWTFCISRALWGPPVVTVQFYYHFLYTCIHKRTEIELQLIAAGPRSTPRSESVTGMEHSSHSGKSVHERHARGRDYVQQRAFCCCNKREARGEDELKEGTPNATVRKCITALSNYVVALETTPRKYI